MIKLIPRYKRPLNLLIIIAFVSTIFFYTMSNNNTSNTPTPLSTLIEQAQLIITDFDDTITAGDSLHLLFDAVAAVKPQFEHDVSHYTSVYLASRERFRDANSALIQTRFDAVANEVRYQQLMKDVELSSVRESVETKVFQGLHRRHFQSRSAEIITKDGFFEFLKRVHRRIPVVILSVNWSYAMLENYFRDAGYAVDDENVFLLTNEFVFDSNGVCTGEVAEGPVPEGIRTGHDKLLLTRQLIDKFKCPGQVVYVGDSETDVLSMLESGKSVSMRRETHGAAEVLQKFGKSLNRVDSRGDWHYLVDDWNDML